MLKLTPIAALFSVQLILIPIHSQALAADYDLIQNQTPGAMVTSSFSHYAGGVGITPYYGYYNVEIPTMNDSNVIVGRVDKTNATFPMVKGTDSGEAAKWVNGSVETLGVVNCKDENQDGIADNASCGSRALSINENGLIGGASHDWLAGRDTYFEKAYTFLGSGTFGGSPFSSFISQGQVQDINASGASVGTGITNGAGSPYDGLAHGVISPASGSDNIVGVIYQSSQAHAINKFLMATGSATFNNENQYSPSPSATQSNQVYRYSDKIYFGGFLPGGTFSIGYDINDNGVIVGLASDANNQSRAFLWNSKYISGETHYLTEDKYGSFTNLNTELESFLQDLGTLKADDSGNSFARSVNNHDQVVGWSETDNNEKHAFIYENGTMQDLNIVIPNLNGWTLVDAYKVNEKGHILVRGVRNSENTYMIVSPNMDLPILNITQWADPEPTSIIPKIPTIDGIGPQSAVKTLNADYYVCNASCKTTILEYNLTAAETLIANNAYLTIQTALNAASDNQTVMVLPGVYNENITLPSYKYITLESWKGADSTIIDATGITQINVVYMKNGILDGFTITGGTSSTWNDQRYGGGIYVSAYYNKEDPIIIKNNIITNNSTCSLFVPTLDYFGRPSQCAGFGAAIMAGSTNNLTISNNLITNSTDYGVGYGSKSAIHLYRANNASIDKNIISNNLESTGGITFESSNYVTIDSTIFTKLTGIAIKINSATSTLVKNSIFTGNFSSSVIYNYYNDRSFKLYNSIIAYNEKGNTNALFLTPYNIIENSIIWDNARADYNMTYNRNGLVVSNGVKVTNSIIEFGYPSSSSTNVIDADPLFVDPANGNFELTPLSPGVDSGSDLTSLGISTDIAGAPRPQDGNANGVPEFDMGVFEQ